MSNQKPERHPKFFFHLDGSYLMYVPPPITAERFVHETVGSLDGTQVDGIICHMFTGGDSVPLYATEIEAARSAAPEKYASVHIWRKVRNFEAMMEMPEDPWKLAIDAAHARGKPFWGAMRFNDSHPPMYALHSRLLRDHPEYRLGSRCGAPVHSPGPDGKVWECRRLDYSIPEVRAHRLKLIEEVCARYEIDGFEWDFTRDAGHNFPAGKEDAGRGILNDFVCEARALINRVASKRGRPLGFAARVSGSLDACRRFGLDVEQWVRDDVFDIITPTVFYDTACELPFDEFVALARDHPCRIYANVTEGVGPGRFRPPPPEAVRAGALNAWRQGVDGINLFNFHHHVIAGRPGNLNLLCEMGSPATLERRDKLYMIAGIGVISQSRYFEQPYQTAHHHQLPGPLNVGERLDIRVPIGDDVAAARRDGVLGGITLRLDLLHVTGFENLHLSINGRDCPLDRASWQPSDQYPWNWNGMHGHLEACLDLTHDELVRQGDNTFSLELRDRPDDLEPALSLYALRVEIRYSTLPVRIGSRSGHASDAPR